MTRTTWGVLVLLLGTSGCISIYPEPVPEPEKKREAWVPPPSQPTWAARDGERSDKQLPSRFKGDDVARTVVPPPPAPVAPAATSPTAVAWTNTPASMPAVTTSGKVPSLPPAPTPVTTAGLASAAGPDPAAERQVSYVTSEPVREPALVPTKPETKAPAKGVAVTPPTKADLAAGKAVTADQTKGGKGAPPLMRMVNSKRITLNFKVDDVGPSGLSGVELWYTQDCKDWKKHDAPPQAHSYVIEVDEEGMYGFTLLAKSGLGLGKEPPAPGDLPQVWVMVDLSKPVVSLGEITPNVNGKTGSVAIRWKAVDKNLGSTPVGLSYAEKDSGPWRPIATNLENTGRYVWQVPASAPASFYLRVDATDLAGNLGRAQTAKAVLLDTSRPTVSILDVESAAVK
jgi:hypothetical protein